MVYQLRRHRHRPLRLMLANVEHGHRLAQLGRRVHGGGVRGNGYSRAGTGVQAARGAGGGRGSVFERGPILLLHVGTQ